MRILIATDAFRPQVNGVVRSLEALAVVARTFDAHIDFLSPQGFPTVPLPTYGEIRLALTGWRGVASRIAALERQGPPIDHIHIATEGPVGHATRRFCLRRGLPFTTSYHTRFPEYISARTPVPAALTYAFLRRFHNAGDGIMVATPSLALELGGRGFQRLMRWSRGVDDMRFHPGKRAPWDLPRPIFLYAGRLAPEKDIDRFLSLDLPGSKVVVGDGPSGDALKRAYPTAHFLGVKGGDDLARIYASSDVFVFPSRTDTFGMVLLEAMASGLPVAAFPVPGPLDVIDTSGAGVLDVDLRAACLAALNIPRATARAHAETFTWANATQQFLDNIAVARTGHFSRRADRASGKQGQLFGQGHAIEP
jgi:glycosyltransferase involved in cell wall biosynthesis